MHVSHCELACRNLKISFPERYNLSKLHIVHLNYQQAMQSFLIFLAFTSTNFPLLMICFSLDWLVFFLIFLAQELLLTDLFLVNFFWHRSVLPYTVLSKLVKTSQHCCSILSSLIILPISALSIDTSGQSVIPLQLSMHCINQVS